MDEETDARCPVNKEEWAALVADRLAGYLSDEALSHFYFDKDAENVTLLRVKRCNKRKWDNFLCDQLGNTYDNNH